MKNVRTPAAKPNGRSAAATRPAAVEPSSAPASARGPKHGKVAPPSSRKRPAFHGLLKRCRVGAEAVKACGVRATKADGDFLEGLYGLGQRAESDPAAKQALEREYEKAGIKIGKKTTTGYTLVVKLFLGKDEPRNTISRYANTLQLARDEGVKPRGIKAFLRRMGGTTACARELTRRKAAAGGADTARGVAVRPAEEQLSGAPKIRFAEELGACTGNFMLLYAVREADGSFVVLCRTDAPVGWKSPIPAGVVARALHRIRDTNRSPVRARSAP
jgi:hypothetical protein